MEIAFGNVMLTKEWNLQYIILMQYTAGLWIYLYEHTITRFVQSEQLIPRTLDCTNANNN